MVEFFAPGDAQDLARCILMLYHHPDRLGDLVRGSQTFNERYSWAKISDAYASLVERLKNR